MISVEETIDTVKIIIPRRDDINLSRLYNKDLLRLFQLKNVKIRYSDGSNIDKKTGGAKKVHILKEIRNYVSKFFLKSKSNQTVLEDLDDNDDVIITIYKEDNDTFISLRSLQQDRNNEYLCFDKTNITYDILMDLITDIDMQLSYMNNLNIELSTIDVANIYRISGRYIIINSEHITSFLEENINENKMINRQNIKTLVKDLTKDETLFLEGTDIEKLLR